jgi:CRISPR-associated endoribonuclease Cas6
MSFLSSVVFEIVNCEDVELPLTSGEWVHGFFFNWLRQLQADFATEIHARETKPFVCTPVLAAKNLRRYNDGIRFRRGTSLLFRITFFDEEIKALLLSDWRLLAEKKRIRLGENLFEIKRVLSTPGSHIWCEEFREGYQKTELRDFKLRFITPTSFKRADWLYPLPDPDLFIGSVFRRATEVGFSFVNSLENLQGHLGIGQCFIGTASFFLQRVRVLGFTGDVGFRIDQKAGSDVQSDLVKILQLAPYLGVGYKTTMGMGLCLNVNGER